MPTFLFTFFIRVRRAGSTDPRRFLKKNEASIWHGFTLSALRKFMNVLIPSSIITRKASDEILELKSSSF